MLGTRGVPVVVSWLGILQVHPRRLERRRGGISPRMLGEFSRCLSGPTLVHSEPRASEQALSLVPSGPALLPRSRHISPCPHCRRPGRARTWRRTSRLAVMWVPRVLWGDKVSLTCAFDQGHPRCLSSGATRLTHHPVPGQCQAVGTRRQPFACSRRSAAAYARCQQPHKGRNPWTTNQHYDTSLSR